MTLGRTRFRIPFESTLIYLILGVYSLISIFPMALILLNSFKAKSDIFRSPYSFPNPINFVGYTDVFRRGNIALYFGNSLIVTLSALVLIVLLASMVAYALSEFRFFGNRLLTIYFTVGLMIPLRLATVSLVRVVKLFGLHGSLWALILIYTVSGLPMAILILTLFMREVPAEMKDAARIDGASEYLILARVIIPLVRPAIATVVVFVMIPIWNDLWWPLVLAPGEPVRTLTLGISSFVGQFQTNWSALLAALSLSMIPVLLIYVLFSRQLIRGLNDGAVKL
ncbi:MAG: carbohydrate ABC transporter permease [Anaerolineae bacterium]|nr:carbohydrate ABC transporter permease [Anaerolineae bacterium]